MRRTRLSQFCGILQSSSLGTFRNKYHSVRKPPCGPRLSQWIVTLYPYLIIYCVIRINITKPVTKHSLLFWDNFKTPYGLPSSHNPAFYLAWYSPTAFRALTTGGLTHLQNMVTRTLLLSFPAKCESPGLPQSEFF